MDFNYDLFFSYRHKQLDGAITRKVFNILESYKLPSALEKKGYSNIRRAFRDTEELAVSRILTETIDKALHSTNCLIIVCSTDTPSSEWVDREVAEFIELGRAEYIYPLLISGSPEVSFPPSLKLVPDIQDRVMDIRSSGNNIKEMLRKADTELLKVISGVSGCPLQELQREHNMRKTRRGAVRASAAVGVFLTVGLVSLGLMGLAESYRDEAQTRRDASMEVLNQLTYNLPDKLTGIKGAYPLISDILLDNTNQINEIVMLSGSDDEAMFEVGANYEKLATAMNTMGYTDEAAESERQAIEIFGSLENDNGSAVASAKSNLGGILHSAGRYEEAAAAYDEAISLQRSLSNDDPVTLAAMLGSAGANLTDMGQYDGAAELLDEGISLLNAIENKDAFALETLADINGTYGTMLYRNGEYDRALAKLQTSLECLKELALKNETAQVRDSIVNTASSIALIMADMGDYAGASECYSEAIEIALQTLDEVNVESLRSLAILYNNLGLCMNMQGMYEQADEQYSEAAALFGQIYGKTGSQSDGITYASAMLNLGENAFKDGDYTESKEKFKQGLSIYEGMEDTLGDYDRGQYYTWLSYYQLIHERDPEAAFETSLDAYYINSENVLVTLNMAYACLYYEDYDPEYEDCDYLFAQLIALGEGQKDTILRDLEAQQQAGMTSVHMDAVIEMVSG